MQDYTATGLTPADGVVLSTPDIYYHDLSVRYTNVENDWSIQAGVTNLTDEEPPIYSSVRFITASTG